MKQFRVIIKIIQDLSKRMEAQTKRIQETFNKQLEALKIKIKNWNEKHTRRNHNRINEAEEWITELEDKLVEITTTEENKGKKGWKWT